MKSFYLLTLAAAVALAACSNDDSTPDPNPSPADTGLVIEQTEYTLDALDNRSATLTFSASADWTLTVTSEDADWLTVTPASGTAGSQTVELAARRNFGEAERIVRLEISCGKQPAPVTVTQHMTDITDFTDRFAPSFARGLQEMGHIYDAGKISRQDMEYLANVIKLDDLSEYTEPLTSLQGIEYFESLRKLDCSDTDLTELVIRNHPSLIELHCSSDPITSLDVSGCTALKTLTCYNSELASLNVSGCTSLQEIMAYRAQLTSLDVSGCSSLQYLDCNENGLTSLKLSGSSPLQHLSCNKNGLTALSLSGCTSLTEVDCTDNQLTELDFSGCSSLIILSCYNNQLTTLNLSNCTSLMGLACDSNQLPSLDISTCTKLRALMCENNPGDGVSTFPITAWFDNSNIPANLRILPMEWTYDDKTIAIDFRKTE